MGLGLFSFAKRLNDENKIILQSIATIAFSIGGFYIAYTLIPIRDFTNFQYYSILTVIGSASGILLVFTYRALKTTEQRLLTIIAALSRFVVGKGKELAGSENEQEYIKAYRGALKKGME